MRNRELKQSGFTIVELMIATAVFSVILLVCTIALLQLGRTYYKGVTSARTQEVARVIIDDVSQAIQFQGGQIGAAGSANGSNGYCVGSTLYSYILNYQLVDGAAGSNQSNHVLIASPSGGACNSSTAPYDLLNTTGSLTGGARELMATNTRLTEFSITPEGSNLYRVSVTVVAGSDDLLSGGSCANVRVGGQFCATSSLSTVVQKRVE